MDNPNTDDTYIITDLETLRVYADPVRVQIFEMLATAPQTVRELAEKLGFQPSKLYYHINLLEKHNLIKVVDTRLVANLVEKQYAAVAANLDVDPQLFSNTPSVEGSALTSVIQSTIDLTREDLLCSLQARLYNLEQGATPKKRELVLNRVQSYLTDEKADEFRIRLVQLMQEFTQASLGKAASGQVDVQLYTLMAAYYPNFYFSPPAAAAKESSSGENSSL